MKVIPVFSGESLVHRDQSLIAECSESLEGVAAKTRDDVQVVHVHSNLQSIETAYDKLLTRHEPKRDSCTNHGASPC